MKVKDLTGQRFGRLIALRRVPSSDSAAKWLCRCDCGKEKAVVGPSLRFNVTHSCGCLRTEHSKSRCLALGLSKAPEYAIWRSMISRCDNPAVKGYHNYGGRGIKVCDRWRIFDTFLSDMGARPNGRMTLERENVDGDYCPSNCRWATQKEQCANKRDNVILSLHGVSKILSDWAIEMGLRRTTLRNRIKAGWSHADALTRPLRWRNA